MNGAQLAVDDLDAGYGRVGALFGVSLGLAAGRTTALLGVNGAGKSTLAAAIAGTVRPSRGRIRLDGADVTALPAHARARLGVAYVPEGRGVFPGLSVLDNLRVGVRRAVPRAERAAAVERAFDQFPRLRERRQQVVGTLSGGEQQMVAMARALAVSPRLLIADEPSLGLAPTVIDVLFESLARARAAGTTVLLVEQYVDRALALADDAVILSQGRLVWRGAADAAAAEVARRYLGEPAPA